MQNSRANKIEICFETCAAEAAQELQILLQEYDIDPAEKVEITVAAAKTG